MPSTDSCIKHVAMVDKLPSNDGLCLFRARRKIGKLSPYSLRSLLKPSCIVIDCSDAGGRGLDFLNNDIVIPTLAIEPTGKILNLAVDLLDRLAPILGPIRAPRPTGSDGSPVAPQLQHAINESPVLILEKSLKFTSVPLPVALSGPDAVGAPEDAISLINGLLYRKKSLLELLNLGISLVLKGSMTPEHSMMLVLNNLMKQTYATLNFPNGFPEIVGE